MVRGIGQQRRESLPVGHLATTAVGKQNQAWGFPERRRNSQALQNLASDHFLTLQHQFVIFDAQCHRVGLGLPAVVINAGNPHLKSDIEIEHVGHFVAGSTCLALQAGNEVVDAAQR